MSNKHYICSLTTIPSKFNTLYKSIDSLLNQTIAPRKIVVNIPRTYSLRFNNAEIPEETLNEFRMKYSNTWVCLNMLNTDYGPGTKLLGLLSYMDLNEFNDDLYIILVDDDVIYKPYMIEGFNRFVKEHENVRSASYCVYTVDNMRDFHIAQGVDGFLMQSSILRKFIEYYAIIKENEYIHYHDDYYISYYLRLMNIYIHHVTRPYNSNIYEPIDSSHTNALSGLGGKFSRQNLNIVLYEVFRKFQSEGVFMNL